MGIRREPFTADELSVSQEWMDEFMRLVDKALSAEEERGDD